MGYVEPSRVQLDGGLHDRRADWRPWGFFGAAALLGSLSTIVMPIATALSALIAGIGGTVLVIGGRHKLGIRFLGVAAGLLVPVSIYLALALLQR